MADPELPRGIALAWGVAEQPMRGPKREMSIERIVDAAVEIADREGLTAVSMSSVATALGYTTMSLYRYVSAKDDLIVLMNEEGVGLPPDHEAGADWRAGLRRWAAAMDAVYRRHPWVLDIPVEGIPMTPNNLAWLDWGLEILADTPLTYAEGVSAVLMIGGLVRWQAGITRMYADSDVLPDHEDTVLQELVRAERYPRVHGALVAGVFSAGAGEDPFAFGVERALDGIEAYLAAVRAQGRPVPDPPVQPPPDEDYPRDSRLRDATRDRREAESRLRQARSRERELIAKAQERAAAERLRARD